MLTSPLEICHLKLVNFLGGRSVAWKYPYRMINLTLKTKNVYSYLKTGKLWQLSTIAVRLGIEGEFL